MIAQLGSSLVQSSDFSPRALNNPHHVGMVVAVEQILRLYGLHHAVKLIAVGGAAVKIVSAKGHRSPHLAQHIVGDSVRCRCGRVVTEHHVRRTARNGFLHVLVGNQLLLPVGAVHDPEFPVNGGRATKGKEADAIDFETVAARKVEDVVPDFPRAVRADRLGIEPLEVLVVAVHEVQHDLVLFETGLELVQERLVVVPDTEIPELEDNLHLVLGGVVNDLGSLRDASMPVACQNDGLVGLGDHDVLIVNSVIFDRSVVRGEVVDVLETVVQSKFPTASIRNTDVAGRKCISVGDVGNLIRPSALPNPR